MICASGCDHLPIDAFIHQEPKRWWERFVDLDYEYAFDVKVASTELVDVAQFARHRSFAAARAARVVDEASQSQQMHLQMSQHTSGGTGSSGGGEPAYKAQSSSQGGAAVASLSVFTAASSLSQSQCVDELLAIGATEEEEDGGGSSNGTTADHSRRDEGGAGERHSQQSQQQMVNVTHSDTIELDAVNKQPCMARVVQVCVCACVCE